MSNLVREKLEDYFASINPTSSRMMADIVSVRQEHSKDFDCLPQDEQSDILWRSIVKADASKKYDLIKKEVAIEECFPVLRTCPGEKIIVDEDATAGRPFGCSWRDEHSAPFRWETQSQLDLRLDGEEPEDNKVKTLEKPTAKAEDTLKNDLKKDEEVKRSTTVKRPEVPPPPVPPHCSPPPPPHVEVAQVPKPVEKKDTPIYAKVVKRKSATSKTLDMRIRRKSKEEAKPAVPPRMSLELRKEIDISKYKTLPIDFDDIPKTGFDFLDNW